MESSINLHCLVPKKSTWNKQRMESIDLCTVFGVTRLDYSTERAFLSVNNRSLLSLPRQLLSYVIMSNDNRSTYRKYSELC